MKQFISEYASFNIWANERICSVVEKVSEEQLSKEIISSFPSIKQTLLHLWDAQLIWIRRLEGISPTSFPSQNFSGTRQDIIEGIISTSNKLKDLADNLDEELFHHVRKYSTLRGGIVTSATYQVFAHVFNHSTYHRGQLVTMLRQAGVSEIPQTDLIYFYRELRSKAGS